MANNLNPWRNETDWLVSLVWLDDKDDPESRARAGDEIGYLFGFAIFTDTRIMAEIGDDLKDITVFQLLFSFNSQASKKTFLDLVKANDLTCQDDEEVEQFSVPTRSEIDGAEPLGAILPDDISDRATIRAALVFETLSTHGVGISRS